MRVRCVLTVLGLKKSSSAICLTVLPEAIIHITWYSRSESVSCSGLPRLSSSSSASFSPFGYAHGLLEECELLAQRGRDVASAARHLADGADQLFGRALLGEISRRPCLERAHGVAILRVHRKVQHCAARIALAQLFDELEPVLAGHVVVEHGDFPRHAPRELDHFLAVARLADDREVLLYREHLPEALTDYRVIVCDDDFHFGHALCRTGIDTDTRVP